MTKNVESDMYGHEVQSSSSASVKPSPFTETVDIRKQKVRQAAKVRPVAFEQVPVEEQTYLLDLPRASKAVYQLDLPVRTQPAVYQVN